MPCVSLSARQRWWSDGHQHCLWPHGIEERCLSLAEHRTRETHDIRRGFRKCDPPHCPAGRVGHCQRFAWVSHPGDRWDRLSWSWTAVPACWSFRIAGGFKGDLRRIRMLAWKRGNYANISTCSLRLVVILLVFFVKEVLYFPLNLVSSGHSHVDTNCAKYFHLQLRWVVILSWKKYFSLWVWYPQGATKLVHSLPVKSWKSVGWWGLWYLRLRFWPWSWWFRLLGRKWQHWGSYFCDCKTSFFNRQEQKSMRKTAVHVFVNSMLPD